MCKVYNQIGSLTEIKWHLRKHNVDEFKSVNELINFQKNYSVLRKQIISNHNIQIEQEKNTLKDEIKELDTLINAKRNELELVRTLHSEKLNHELACLSLTHFNLIHAFINFIKRTFIKSKARINKIKFESAIVDSVKNLNQSYKKANARYQYIDSHFEDAVVASSLPQLQELERKKRVIDQINNTIYGALGEQKVVRELENLSDDYILINDFKCSFQPAIYNRNENDYIKSIQIDHVLLSPSGIFIIETKNWSQQSLKDVNLFSPVQQIKRTNFALYKILNGDASNFKLNKHRWGDRKIPIKNLIVFINHKPIEEFQHVKILTLNELLRYVNYFKPCFSTEETQITANYLLHL